MNEDNTTPTDEDDGFAAGFAGTLTETPGTTAQEAQTTDDATPGADDASGQPEPAAPEYAQLTRQELEELKARAALIDEIKATQPTKFDQVFGKIGGIERQLKEMASGATVDIDQADIDALREDGFEAMAKALEKVRNLRAIPTAAAFDENAVQALVQQRIEPIVQRLETRLLEKDHPDWQQIDKDPEFAKFNAAQGPEYLQKLAKASNEFDSAVISEAIARFKEHRKQQATKPAAGAQPQGDRKSRMSAAVTPQGSGRQAATSTDDDFMAGFKSAFNT